MHANAAQGAAAAAAQVESRAEMAALLEQGALLRATGATGMNRHSSRSHAIFTITVEQRRILSTASGAGPWPSHAARNICALCQCGES